ncbi:hypothetical protein [Bdellovibrio sp. HCB337]|uniref:hypothetical protein n=1 Tax=Bdellovibrio sp. HCB337 TaxID=3394358 RepID=UPI0039A5C826
MNINSGILAILLLLLILFTLPAQSAVCTTPKVASTCCDYTFYDGHTGKDVTYRGPQTVFGNETDARNWAKPLFAHMPFFLPFEESIISMTQGWTYDGGGDHSGIDWQRSSVTANTDVSFEVRAIAAGRVVTKTWDNWHGNLLVIEHTAGDGTKYRSIYMHLRDGYTHDRNAAKAIVPSDPDGNDNVAKYARYAKNNSNKLYWGEESHTIAVNVGDWVNTGQFLARSGNTGPGGAGAGLNNDGTPSDTTRANNHLHFMLSVENPKTAGEWVFVDAYGVYAKANTGCYDLMKDIEYPRFFAPYFPNFHNIGWDLYKFYFSYYPNMGLGPQTLSLYAKRGQVLAAGAFHDSVKGPWAVRGYLTTDELSYWFTVYNRQGMRPREIQVLSASDGTPRFTVIWQRRGNEGYATWVNLNDAQFKSMWDDLVVRQGYRVEDYVGYTIGSERRHGVNFVKDGQGFYLWYNLTQSEFDLKFRELWNQGWRTTSFNAAALPWGERYGGVWMQKPGAWVTWFNMSPADYQQKFDLYSGQQGYRLWKVQGYGNGSRFGAIWTK